MVAAEPHDDVGSVRGHVPGERELVDVLPEQRRAVRPKAVELDGAAAGGANQQE